MPDNPVNACPDRRAEIPATVRLGFVPPATLFFGEKATRGLKVNYARVRLPVASTPENRLPASQGEAAAAVATA